MYISQLNQSQVSQLSRLQLYNINLILKEVKSSVEKYFSSGKPEEWKDNGICRIFSLMSCGTYVGITSVAVIGASAKSWPNYSGNFSFPISIQASELTARGQFRESRNLWDQTTDYGKLRLDLLNHCIKFYEDVLKQAEQEHAFGGFDEK